jgi:tetratricopeptide (TPR) repeat protein
VPVTGLGAGELLTGIDVRPLTGRVVATSDAGRVLILDPATGTVAPTLPAAFGVGPFGQDFDPVQDRLNSVDSTARHVSYDPVTGDTAEREHLSYLPGDPHAGAGTDERAYAVLATPGSTRSALYRVNLGTGAATRIGDVGVSHRYGGLALLPPERGAIQASSDAWPDTDLDDEELLIGIDRGTVCPPDGPYRNLALPAALSSAEAFLRQHAGQAALDAYAASPEYDDALQSVRAGAAAISAGEPGAALTTLLRAHELRPTDPTILLNAGGVAASVGLGSEALAMIRAAQALPAPESSPMGLAWTGRVQIAYAHAYTSLSQWDNVEKAAKSAREQEPDLGSEAANELAAVKLCRDDDTAAAAAYRARARVRNEKPTPIDETRGKVMHLRNIPLPALPVNASHDADFYWQFVLRLGSETVANAQRNRELFDKLDKPADPTVKRRRAGLLSRSAKVTGSAPAHALLDAVSKDIDDAMKEHERLFGPQGRYIQYLQEASDACSASSDDKCFTNEMRARCVPETRLRHSAWLDEVTEAYRLEGRYIELISRRMSGIGANIADEDHVLYVLNQIEDQEITAATRIVQEANFWAVAMRSHADYCVEEMDPPTPAEPPTPEAEGERCTKSAKAYSVKAELTSGTTAAGNSYKVGVKMNCDEAKIEGSVSPLPFIHAFASAGYAAKSGETTVVIGGKAKVDGKVVSGDFQSGVYVKFDHGEFHDVGWRFGPSVSATSSMVEYTTKDTTDLSFIEGIRYLKEGMPD